MGMVLALSRAFIIDSGVAFDPEAALMGVVAHTHYLPRHWRGRWVGWWRELGERCSHCAGQGGKSPVSKLLPLWASIPTAQPHAASAKSSH